MIEWSEQHQAIRDMFRRFVEAEISPRREEFEHGDTKTIPGLARPLPNLKKLEKPVPALKSIVTHPPKLNAKVSKGPAPGAL